LASHKPLTNNPIGIFDSGLGGLSILTHVQQLLAHESLIYIADSGYAPYGCQDKQFIETRCRVITEYLLTQKVKAIVIACNTATAFIIEQFRQDYGIPFIGVEPGIKPAVALSNNSIIGIMATSATIQSQRYNKLSLRYAQTVNLYHQSCPGLADQVEKGALNSTETIILLKRYIQPLMVQKVDTIVLGCTHYSFLAPLIQQLVGDNIILVDTSLAIARQLIRVLACPSISDQGVKKPMDIRQKLIQYYTTASIVEAEQLISQLLNDKVTVKALIC
jgi:glutamate racemase